jgi:hypothetical protein
VILNAKQAQDSVTREKGVRRSSSDLTMVQRRSLEFVRMPCLDKRLKEVHQPALDLEMSSDPASPASFTGLRRCSTDVEQKKHPISFRGVRWERERASLEMVRGMTSPSSSSSKLADPLQSESGGCEPPHISEEMVQLDMLKAVTSPILTPAAAAAAAAVRELGRTPAERLDDLQGLLDAGLITQDEYDAQRSVIIASV